MGSRRCLDPAEPYRWDPPSDDGTGLWAFAVGLAILTTTVLWLVAGLVKVRRLAAGEGGGDRSPGSRVSARSAGATWSSEEALATALFTFQTVALVAYAALLWTPVPVTPAHTDAA